MLVCRDDTVPRDPSPPGDLGAAVDEWVARYDARGRRVTGDALAGETHAMVVRVRGGRTQATEGPVLATGGALLGFDVLECSDLDEAVAVAAAHPLARRCALEIRPVAHDEDD